MVPAIACCLLVIFSGAVGFRAFFNARPSMAKAAARPFPWSVAILVVASCLYTVMMPAWGYYVDTWLLGLVILALGRPGAWRQNVIGASIITFLFYLVFGLGLSVAFPHASILKWF